jgi:hypothetical protein
MRHFFFLKVDNLCVLRSRGECFVRCDYVSQALSRIGVLRRDAWPTDTAVGSMEGAVVKVVS